MNQAVARPPADAPPPPGGTPPAPARGRRFGLRLGVGRAGGRYTRFVALMRIVLPLVAGVLVLLVVIWPQLQQQTRKFRLGLSGISLQDGGGQQAINARFTGTDQMNRPFNVTADSATQNPERTDEVDLAFPKADITLKDGSWIALTAERGRFYRDGQVLDLSGGVNMFHDSGFEFRTATARVEFSDSSAVGESPVQGQGPFGTLTAAGFRVLDGGKRVLFTGKAKLVFWPTPHEGKS